MPAFDVNRALLNPRFDGYKFALLEGDEIASHYPLDHKLSQANVSGRTPLSFQEVQSRVSHNHLAICSQSRRAVYVDAELRVVGIDIDESLRPAFRVLLELPRSIHSAEATRLQREYPSATFVDGTSLFVSDGQGVLYAVRINDSGEAAELLATYELAIPPVYDASQASVPFLLHSAIACEDQKVVLVLSSRYYPNSPPASTTSKPSSIKFDVWGVQVPLPIASSTEAKPLDILWHRRSDDVPVFTAYDTSRSAFLLVGHSPYLPMTTRPAAHYEPAPDEAAPIPRAGENLDVNGVDNNNTPGAGPGPRPPPYSWTQTTDSVTLAIPVPSDTPTSHIKVAFSPRSLTVLVERPTAAPTTTSDVPLVLPRYTLRALWAGIQPASSLWTFDRAADRRYGLLTLHLDKQHEGTRWPQVFAAPGGRALPHTQPQTREGEEEEVPETLDPSELYLIREALEKYTEAAAGAQGLGEGVPSLAEGERDDEVDLSVGKSVCATWVPGHGGGEEDGGHDDGAPVQLLSTPFPGTKGASEISLVAKHGLDGVVVTLKVEEEEASGLPVWKHTATFSALSFVLASKRDTRFVHHVSSKAVFAFESGGQDLGGNVYIYRGASPRENRAGQTVLKIGGGTAGSLLGVGLMEVRDKTAILCLCEGELTVLHDVV